jgi:isopenicillin-N N-acyltransferase like protein
MPENRSTRKKTGKRILFFLLGVILVFIVYFFSVAIDHPPEVDDLSLVKVDREKVGNNAFFFGKNWIRKSESGLWEMYIEGDPFERGLAFGKLTKELLFYQETAFIEQIQELVPSPVYLKFLKYFTAWFNRNLDKHITDEYKLEIYGTSFSCSSMYNYIGSKYQRQLNYHAAHDIGHALQGLNMVGCTSFSCWGNKSSDSTLLVARNFDFYSGKKFAENKIVCFCKPATGYKFMMITWADMIGVVSGMNEKGLTVTINASKSAIPYQASTPVALLAREILQYSSNLDQAFAIAAKRKLFVSESILVGSAKDRKSAIIEKSPHTSDIVFSETDQIVCANHFQGKAFVQDKTNRDNIAGSDSKYRFDRVNELLRKDTAIDVYDAAAILRNRFGKDDRDLGMGNPLAINQLIAHHAVIFKPEQLTVWVSTSPYQLGKFVAYDLNKVFSLTPEEIAANHEIYSGNLTIPADSFLYSNKYLDFTKYLKMTTELKHYTKNKTPLPASFENSYIQCNPQLYLTYSNLAGYYRVMDQPERACNFYQQALTKEVAGRNRRNEIIKISQKTANKIRHAHTGN